MRQRVSKLMRFLRTTAIGGLLFLLPLFVIGGLLGYLYTAVIAVYEPLRPWLPGSDATVIATLFAAALAALVLLCFAAGLIARRAIGRQVAKSIERQLTAVFPRYAVYKDLLAGNLGGHEHHRTLQPVIVERIDHRQMAFEADRLANGLVVIYFPGSPDAWTGSVGLVEADKVQPLEIPFLEALAICERLGRDSSEWLDKCRFATVEEARGRRP